MKYITLLLLINLTFYSANAQKTQDVVYLNNGGILRGKILENNSDSLKIEIYNRNVFGYKKTEIKAISVEPLTTNFPIKHSGYFNFTSIGTVFGSALNDKPAPFSLLMENNYRTGKNFAFGALTGIEFLNEAVMPLAGNIKILFPSTNGNNFFIGISGGYSISLETPESIEGDYYYSYKVTEATGGVMFNSEVGANFPIKNNLALFLAAGYRYNELNYKREDWQFTNVDRTLYYNRVSLRIGLTFY